MKTVRTLRIAIAAAVFALLAVSVSHASQAQPRLVIVDSLRCEYLKDPLGIDVLKPRFTWQITDSNNARGQKQTAYQMLVASSPALLEQGRGDIWDSGKVASSQSALVPFAGKELHSDQDCYWKVRVWDMDKHLSAWSEPARFSMGLLRPEDWAGPWIKHPDAPPEKHIWFRKKFELERKPVSAFIHVASVGYHELYVNGKKVDDRVLAPALTRLDKRVLYVTYDVAKLLNVGANTIALWTGPGWARYAEFKTVPALRVQLNAKTEDGKTFAISSDKSWRCAISSSENIGGCGYKDNGGEKIDARNAVPNWNASGFDDHQWKLAVEAPITATLSAQMVEPTRVIETIPAQSITENSNSAYRVDLGKNFTGWLEIKMIGQAAGDRVVIKVADDIGTVQDFGQRSEYVCKGGEGETFRNRFNFAAGRYIMIEGLKTKPQLADITGLALGTDLERTGHFACSNPLFNEIYKMDLWTYRVNTIEAYTMDCPHRERLGYGEEAFATAWGIGMPNYCAGAFYTKLVRDWSDVQEENGWINHTAPQINQHYGGAMWSSAGLSIAWEFYQTYGDTRILELTYPSSKRWLEFLNASVSNGVLRSYTRNGGKFLGDWAAPGGRKEFGDKPEAEYFNNCVYAMNLATFIQMARILGRTEDVVLYSQRLLDLKEKVQARFFDKEKSIYSTGTQVQQAFALITDITPKNLRAAVAATIEKDITETHPYMDMGSSGLPVLLKYLIEDSERGDLLFSPLCKTNEPSYGYFLARGETAWPEYWNVDVPSRMHTCFTGIAAWFTKSLAGIRPDPAHPGYQSFLIKPLLAGNLTLAEASTESLYGPITSRWDRNGNRAALKVTIPPNSEATVYLPTHDGKSVKEGGKDLGDVDGITPLRMEGNHVVLNVKSGHYDFSFVAAPIQLDRD